MRVLAFAWRTLVRQRARSLLGVLGVAAVGALLFDMLLLSEGLVISMRDLFERQGYDIRVTAGDSLPGQGPDVTGAAPTAAAIATLPSVRSVITLKLEDADLVRAGMMPVDATFIGAGGGPARPWTVLRGTDLTGERQMVINESAARTLGVEPGASLTVRASCSRGGAPPAIPFQVTAVVRFPFDTPGAASAGTTMASLAEACGSPDAEDADFFLVQSNGNPAAAADAIAGLRPDLRTFTNEQLISRLQSGGFSYFQQISSVLTVVTVSFALLLITVLMTVSVNQRLGEIAALRALGFSQRRVVADVLCESALLVGIGGLLSLPLGLVMATWLDTILKRMPGIPTDLHFFAFNPSALAIHLGLLAVTALLAAIYPMRIVARLPIAATLRAEVLS